MKAVVVGLGQSAHDARRALEECYTVGVNDVASFHQPNELLILDRRGRFTEKRQVHISCTRAARLWSPYEEWQKVLPDVPFRQIRTLKYSKVDPYPWGDDVVATFLTSPIAGIALAYNLGATEIGVIGMDLLPDHHMHVNAGRINHVLGCIHEDFSKRGRKLFNCSPIAQITSLPYRDIYEMREDEDCI
jgi:hypothetical protein